MFSDNQNIKIKNSKVGDIKQIKVSKYSNKKATFAVILTILIVLIIYLLFPKQVGLLLEKITPLINIFAK